mmetsp:Transcript_8517/g.28484  ORF Transcript_8517/g.28484 Transcript_8517/m.28484 type:complete len:221 (+) Transcript_8517:1600-2262(+)
METRSESKEVTTCATRRSSVIESLAPVSGTRQESNGQSIPTHCVTNLLSSPAVSALRISQGSPPIIQAGTKAFPVLSFVSLFLINLLSSPGTVLRLSQGSVPTLVVSTRARFSGGAEGSFCVFLFLLPLRSFAVRSLRYGRCDGRYVRVRVMVTETTASMFQEVLRQTFGQRAVCGAAGGVDVRDDASYGHTERKDLTRSARLIIPTHVFDIRRRAGNHY